jgi:hypothetical protein
MRSLTGVLALIVAGVALLVFQATRDPGVRIVAYDPALAAVAAARLVTLPPGHVSVRFSEGELTALGRVYLDAAGDTQTQDLSIACYPGVAVVYAHRYFAGYAYPATAHVTATVAGGRLVYSVSQVSAGRVPIPPPVSESVAAGVEATLQALEPPPGITLQSIEIDDGSVVLTGLKSGR